MSTPAIDLNETAPLSEGQRLFLLYFTAILIDLVVLNLFAEYWQHVTVDSFTVSMLAAALLQVLLKLTLAIEHRVADYFNARPGKTARVLRFFCAWLILFASKFVILAALDIVFGGSVEFDGPLHGIVALIAVLIVMVAAEEGVLRLYRSLGD
ncbi:MAG: hypothetical protein QNJ00_02950 [Woeseiaceae bacterium]|nr:hypothetical protein [Woeseiaceae bacterium]